MTKLLIQIFQDLTVKTKGLKDGKVNRVYVSLWLTAVWVMSASDWQQCELCQPLIDSSVSYESQLYFREGNNR